MFVHWIILAINCRRMHCKSDYKLNKCSFHMHRSLSLFFENDSKQNVLHMISRCSLWSKLKNEKRKEENRKYFLLLKEPEFCFWTAVKSEWMQILACSSLWPTNFCFFFSLLYNERRIHCECSSDQKTNAPWIVWFVSLNEIIVRIFKASKMRSIACVIFAQIKKKTPNVRNLNYLFCSTGGHKTGSA